MRPVSRLKKDTLLETLKDTNGIAVVICLVLCAVFLFIKTYAMLSSDQIGVLFYLLISVGLAVYGMVDIKEQYNINRQQAVPTYENPDYIFSIFPVVYRKENEFEIRPYLDLSRRDEVWGFEILPNLFFSKKCGSDGNVEQTDWYSCKAFAEKMCLNGKNGFLPFKKILKKNWNRELRGKIQAMDRFLCYYDVDAETRSATNVRYIGNFWCREILGFVRYSFFSLSDGLSDYSFKGVSNSYYRLAISFDEE